MENSEQIMDQTRFQYQGLSSTNGTVTSYPQQMLVPGNVTNGTSGCNSKLITNASSCTFSYPRPRPTFEVTPTTPTQLLRNFQVLNGTNQVYSCPPGPIQNNVIYSPVPIQSIQTQNGMYSYALPLPERTSLISPQILQSASCYGNNSLPYNNQRTTMYILPASQTTTNFLQNTTNLQPKQPNIVVQCQPQTTLKFIGADGCPIQPNIYSQLYSPNTGIIPRNNVQSILPKITPEIQPQFANNFPEDNLQPNDTSAEINMQNSMSLVPPSTSGFPINATAMQTFNSQCVSYVQESGLLQMKQGVSKVLNGTSLGPESPLNSSLTLSSLNSQVLIKELDDENSCDSSNLIGIHDETISRQPIDVESPFDVVSSTSPEMISIATQTDDTEFESFNDSEFASCNNSEFAPCNNSEFPSCNDSDFILVTEKDSNRLEMHGEKEIHRVCEPSSDDPPINIQQINDLKTLIESPVDDACFQYKEVNSHFPKIDPVGTNLLLENTNLGICSSSDAQNGSSVESNSKPHTGSTTLLHLDNIENLNRCKDGSVYPNFSLGNVKVEMDNIELSSKLLSNFNLTNDKLSQLQMKLSRFENLECIKQNDNDSTNTTQLSSNSDSIENSELFTKENQMTLENSEVFTKENQIVHTQNAEVLMQFDSELLGVNSISKVENDEIESSEEIHGYLNKRNSTKILQSSTDIKKSLFLVKDCFSIHSQHNKPPTQNEPSSINLTSEIKNCETECTANASTNKIELNGNESVQLSASKQQLVFKGLSAASSNKINLPNQSISNAIAPISTITDSLESLIIHDITTCNANFIPLPIERNGLQNQSVLSNEINFLNKQPVHEPSENIELKAVTNQYPDIPINYLEPQNECGKQLTAMSDYPVILATSLKSKKGRPKKLKAAGFLSNSVTTLKRKRGRPKKFLTKINSLINLVPILKRKRGRPKKIEKEFIEKILPNSQNIIITPTENSSATKEDAVKFENNYPNLKMSLKRKRGRPKQIEKRMVIDLVSDSLSASSISDQDVSPLKEEVTSNLINNSSVLKYSLRQKRGPKKKLKRKKDMPHSLSVPSIFEKNDSSLNCSSEAEKYLQKLANNFNNLSNCTKHPSDLLNLDNIHTSRKTSSLPTSEPSALRVFKTNGLRLTARKKTSANLNRIKSPAVSNKLNTILDYSTPLSSTLTQTSSHITCVTSDIGPELLTSNSMNITKRLTARKKTSAILNLEKKLSIVSQINKSGNKIDLVNSSLPPPLSFGLAASITSDKDTGLSRNILNKQRLRAHKKISTNSKKKRTQKTPVDKSSGLKKAAKTLALIQNSSHSSLIHSTSKLTRIEEKKSYSDKHLSTISNKPATTSASKKSELEKGLEYSETASLNEDNLSEPPYISPTPLNDFVIPKTFVATQCLSNKSNIQSQIELLGNRRRQLDVFLSNQISPSRKTDHISVEENLNTPVLHLSNSVTPCILTKPCTETNVCLLSTENENKQDHYVHKSEKSNEVISVNNQTTFSACEAKQLSITENINCALSETNFDIHQNIQFQTEYSHIAQKQNLQKCTTSKQQKEFLTNSENITQPFNSGSFTRLDNNCSSSSTSSTVVSIDELSTSNANNKNDFDISTGTSSSQLLGNVSFNNQENSTNNTSIRSTYMCNISTSQLETDSNFLKSDISKAQMMERKDCQRTKLNPEESEIKNNNSSLIQPKYDVTKPEELLKGCEHSSSPKIRIPFSDFESSDHTSGKKTPIKCCETQLEKSPKEFQDHLQNTNKNNESIIHSEIVYSDWKREEVRSVRNPKRVNVYYYPPPGHPKLCSHLEIQTYCENNDFKYKAELFTFHPRNTTMVKQAEIIGNNEKLANSESLSEPSENNATKFIKVTRLVKRKLRRLPKKTVKLHVECECGNIFSHRKFDSLKYCSRSCKRKYEQIKNKKDSTYTEESKSFEEWENLEVPEIWIGDCNTKTTKSCKAEMKNTGQDGLAKTKKKRKRNTKLVKNSFSVASIVDAIKDTSSITHTKKRKIIGRPKRDKTIEMARSVINDTSSVIEHNTEVNTNASKNFEIEENLKLKGDSILVSDFLSIPKKARKKYQPFVNLTPITRKNRGKPIINAEQ